MSMPGKDVADELLSREPSMLRNLWASISSVIVKDSRWRMRGRRAFVIVTVYVSILALLMSCVQTTFEQSARATLDTGMAPGAGASASMSALIGQALFTLVLVVQTLLTLALAPALTSGAISMEREKQTLELLITTPISTLGMVIGKLFSSLAYVFLLILVSIPLMSIVFAFGGIAPEDVIRAYVLLFAVAFGLGSVGLFLSALTKRTQLAAALAYVIVFVLAIVSILAHTYMLATSTVFGDDGSVRQVNPPEFILWLNPLVADVDLACTAIPETYGFTCAYISAIGGTEMDPASPPRDAFWPRSAMAFVVLGVGLTLWSTQLIAPSRRLRRGPRVTGPTSSGAAPPVPEAAEAPSSAAGLSTAQTGASGDPPEGVT